MGIGCSIGVCRGAGGSYEQLYQQADAALYAAKRKGKGCVCWAEDAPER